MARPTKHVEPIADVKVNEQAVKEAAQQTDEASAIVAKHQSALVATIGEVANLPTEQLWTEVRFFAQNAAVSMMEMGVRLVALKERSGHGEFMSALEAQGFAPRTARLYMAAALKLTGPKRQSIAVLSLPTTKLLDLASLPDDELDALAEGKTVAGLKLDELDTMSTREMRAAIRELRDEKKASDRLIAEKDKKINALDRTITRLPDVRAFGDRAKGISESVGPCVTAVEDAVSIMAQLMTQATTPANDEEPATPEEMGSVVKSIVDAVQRIDAMVAALRKAATELQNNVPGLSAYAQD